jgi:hypothetical protein
MPYHPTIDEDLAHADKIIAAGRGNGEGSTIHGVDNHAAYYLLQSFTEHIRDQRDIVETARQVIEQLEPNVHRVEDLWLRVEKNLHAVKRYAATKPLPPQRMGPLSADHPAVNKPCPGCRRAILAGAFVTLLAVGPGDDPEEREKARNGRPYNAVAVAAHWECVTGDIES